MQGILDLPLQNYRAELILVNTGLQTILKVKLSRKLKIINRQMQL